MSLAKRCLCLRIPKWYLALGALASETGVWTWMGPAVLLVSTLLTAGYLLPLTIQGFFPGTDLKRDETGEGGSPCPAAEKVSAWMLAPVFVLTAGALWFGCFPGLLLSMLEKIASGVL